MKKQFNFSERVKEVMGKKGITQTDLVNSSLLSKTTISRIVRNSNDKGGSYMPTWQVVWAVSIGLKLTQEEAKELLFIAFPEMKLWGYFLNNRLDIYQVNDILYENGLALWGSRHAKHEPHSGNFANGQGLR